MSNIKEKLNLRFLQQKREDILAIAQKHGAKNIRVFGSIARGDADEKSDIDFLVEMEVGRSLFDLGGLQYDLEILLGLQVDVVSQKGLKKSIRDRVLSESIVL
ncbi:nucleotidyltransferase family protein [Synechococcus sp. PCC 6312]|uniref:nucleotidyltransferase family protein n=1 Tax=Synechococcus sp. (strain ATCC 27167 / PCC 6312) TaxID=195253 RepID=UPI00029EDBC4|nr:nucleotidyltransferase family protein [Synechococcus sp. PCC 6312]AFY60096.1 putative nucleotidyltransferase [Synechococcus sp. PCC 6312]